MTDRLSAARKRIDAVDARLAALLARRFALAAPLRMLKGKTADPARERRVLAGASRAAGRRYASAARAVFTEIIRQSKKLQTKK